MQRMIRNPGAHLFGMDCACGASRPFTVGADGVRCEECERVVPCAPPILGVDERACGCGANRTHVFDVAGAYTCTRCGTVAAAELAS